ncbi:MAG: FHA domain-containing protein [Anaerolineae bacterium]|nr:FHA domain-containing protein [Anaerolineae bacterium]MDW8172314.1 FHA domain-containing protein [Anaerolineae bacterium]
MQADTYRLIIKRGPEPGRVIELQAEQAKLGREVQNDIVINDREVSRSHLRFVRGPEGYTVEDLNSTNGTFINGKRISGAVLLKNGDLISLGETVTLGYEVVRAGMPTVPAPAADYGPPAVPPAQPYQPPAPSAPVVPAAQPYQPPAPGAPPYQPPGVPPYQPPAAAPGAPVAPPYQPPGAPPYQPPAPVAPPYQPPGVPPYQPPAAVPGAPDPYAMPAPDPYYGQYGMTAAPGGPGGIPGAPMPNDYDPYAMREASGGGNTGRLVLIGCLGLMLLCCCASIVAVVVVDTLNLYCDIPVVNNILQTLGLIRCVAAGG